MQAYGRHKSEQVLGQNLSGRRRNVVVATKFGYNSKSGSIQYGAVDIDTVGDIVS